MQASELFDGQCHQQFFEDSALLASSEVKSHLKNWALIRSTLRNELPAKVDLNFSDKVMARIEKEEPLAWVPPYEEESDLPSMLQGSFNAMPDKTEGDQASLNTPESLVQVARNKKAPLLNLKKIGLFVSQVAVAASVAVVAVIGLQTYNAAEQSMENMATTASTNVGPVVGLSLASYQSNDNDMVLNVDAIQKSDNDYYQADIKQKRQEELDKINLYVKGYVLDTAANN